MLSFEVCAAFSGMILFIAADLLHPTNDSMRVAMFRFLDAPLLESRVSEVLTCKLDMVIKAKQRRTPGGMKPRACKW